MNRVQWIAAVMIVAVVFSALRVFVAGAYKSLWDLLWYGDWFPGPLGLLGFLAAYYLARPRPLVVAVAAAVYGVLVLAVKDIVLLHVYAGIALAILVYAVSWAARSATAIAAAIAIDTGLRVLAAGLVPIEDTVTAPLVAVLAVVGALLFQAEGRTSTPGYGVFLLLALAVLGLIYPNTILHVSSIHVYGLTEFTVASIGLGLAVLLAVLLHPSRLLRIAQATAAVAVLAEGYWRLAPLYATAGLALASSLQRHTSRSRLEYMLSPLLLIVFSVAAVGVFAYPYIGTWILADRLEVVILAASLLTLLVARKPQPLSRDHVLAAALLALLAPGLAGLAAHTLYTIEEQANEARRHLVIVSYNVHQGYSYNNMFNTGMVAGYVRGLDIVCLQEVDAGRATSAFTDLPLALRVRAKMNYTYMPAIEGVYGVLVATPYTITGSKGVLLTSTGEQRAAVKAVIQTPRGRIVVLNTHLGLDPQERIIQARELLEQALAEPRADILCGDLNEQQGGALQVLQQYYQLPDDKTPTCCLDTGLTERIDYILVHRGSQWRITGYHVDTTAWYSDHLPVKAELEATTTR